MFFLLPRERERGGGVFSLSVCGKFRRCENTARIRLKVIIGGNFCLAMEIKLRERNSQPYDNYFAILLNI